MLGRRDVLEDAPEALAVGQVAALEVEGQRVADDRVVAVIDRRRGADRQRGERHDREPSAEADCGRHARKPTSASSVSCPHREQPRRSRRRRAAPRQPALPALRRPARDRGRLDPRHPRRGDHELQPAQPARGLHGAAEHGRRLLLRDLGLPALPPVPGRALRGPPAAADPRLRAPARAAHRARLLAGADRPRRDGRAVRRLHRRLVGLLRVPAEHAAVDDAVRHRRGVVAGHRGLVLRRAAAVGVLMARVQRGRPARTMVRIEVAALLAISLFSIGWRDDRLRRARDPEPRRHPAARQRRLVRLRDGPRAGHGGPGRSRARVAGRARRSPTTRGCRGRWRPSCGGWTRPSSA